MSAKLLSLATTVPEHVLETAEVIRVATEIFGQRHVDFERMMPVYGNSGINRRYSVKPYDWFRAEQGWPERTEAFVEGAKLSLTNLSSFWVPPQCAMSYQTIE